MTKLSHGLEWLITTFAILSMALVLGLVIWPKVQHTIYPHTQPHKYRTSVAVLSTVRADDAPVEAGATATAFAIDDDHLLTAGHFCAGAGELKRRGLIADRVSIVLADEKGLPLSPIWGHIKAVDQQRDLCLIYSPGHALDPLPLAEDLELLESEDPLVVIGAPRGIFPVRRDGKFVSSEAYRFTGNETKILIVANVQSGSSGSPVIWEGMVIGMIVIQLTVIPDGALATSVVDIQEFLNMHLD